MKYLILLLSLSSTLSFAYGQNLEDYITKYTEKNAAGYLQPLVNAISANLNSGWYHNAKIRKTGFQGYLGAVGMIAPVPDHKKYFIAHTEGLFSPQQSTKAPTIFGNSESVVLQGAGGTTYSFPGGFEVQAVPLLLPQLSIGSLYGTEFSFRFAKVDPGKRIGEVVIAGYGLRHSLSQYFAAWPVDMALGYFRQSFKTGSLIDANINLISLHGSYGLSALILYTGLGYRIDALTLKYPHQGGQTVLYEIEEGNNIRFTLGAGLTLGLLELNADYSVSDQNVFSFGIGIGLTDDKF